MGTTTQGRGQAGTSRTGWDPRRRTVRPSMAGLLAMATAASLVLVPTVDAAAVTRTLGFEQLPNGQPLGDGDVVHDQFTESHHVRFPDGVVVQVCGSGRTCTAAAEGTRVATGKLAHEFANRAVEMIFTVGKNAVAFRVAAFNTSSTDIRATAYDAAGDLVAEETRSSVGRTSWAKVALVDPKGADITRVIITGGTPGTSDNLFAIDALATDGPDESPDAPSDTSQPVVTIRSPADGTTVGETPFNARIDVQETESGLAYVDLEVVHTETGHTTVAPNGGNVCGRSSPCPERHLDEIVAVSLDPGRAGTYRYTFTACDRAGNCGRAARQVVYEPPPDAAPVRVMALEVNQGVQGRILQGITGPGTFQTYPSPVPLVPNRDTVVRVYLGADEEVPGRRVRLHAAVLHEDGTTRRHELVPNADPAAVDVPVARSDADRQLLEMRADLGRTLNFVIRSSDVATADSLQLSVFDGYSPITGTVRVPLGEFNELSFNLIRVVSETTGVPVRRRDVETQLLPYVRAALPVSRSLVISDRTFLWGGKYATFNECESLLFDVWWAYGGHDAPVRPRRDHPVWIPTAAVVDRVDGCTGMAYLGDPQDDDDRIGETLVSERLADTLVHEVGHTLGFLHAGNSHDEDAGWIADLTGTNYESWPYPHGTIGPEGAATTIGVHRSLRSEDHYDLELIDACPTTDADRRLPSCAVDDDLRPHEVMSYGGRRQSIGGHRMGRYRWPSDLTYRRTYNAIVRQLRASRTTSSTRDATTAAADGTTGLLVQGLVDSTGTAHLAPLMRKSVHAGALVADDGRGDLTVELRDDAGRVLASRPAEPTSGHGHETMGFRALLPDVGTATGVVVRHGTRDLGGREASPAAPTVRLTGPGGDELAAGPIEVTWEAADADGETTDALLQASFDDGATWVGLATSRAGARSATIDLTGFPQRGPVMLRVTVTDGFHTASAERRYRFVPDAPTARPTDVACPAPVPDGGFSDVTATNVHAVPIDCIAWWGVTTGIGGGRYGPTREVSRGQMASFVVRLLEQAGMRLPTDPEDRFVDDDGTAHEPAINALAELGVVRGTARGRFEPTRSVTRAQMATYLTQALEARTGLDIPEDVADYFSDDDGTAHERRIDQAASLGVASGTGAGRYDPSASVRRDQMSSFLARLLDLLVVEGHAHPPPR